MRRRLSAVAIACLLATSLPARATMLLDDTWADGTRTNQNLPTESAWFSSSGTAVVAATNSMALTLANNAILGITYFSTNDTSPIRLSVGDTLTAAFKLTFNSVAPPNGSQ